MAKQEDVAAAWKAARELEKAVSAVTRHYPESVDVQRLRADSSRVRDDLALLCGAATPAAPAAQPPPRRVIEDTAYTHDFWMDAEDEGLGRGPQSSH
ncbi:MAG: hypothetical protein JWN88_42 [Frankiales bacterium]|jgi:hypothetical protein|nr:hypothetical protein [Frankiales bacterium]